MTTSLDNSYQLTYAGVPFVLDEARRVHTHIETPEHSPAEQLPARRFQPPCDLVQTIDKMLSLQYLQDFQVPGDDYPGRNLGALALKSPASHTPGTDLKLYDWYYPPTASRWSVFRGLMTSSMVKAVAKATNGGTNQATFTMKQVPLVAGVGSTARYTLSTAMYVLPPRPVGEDGSKGSLDGLYLVTLVDEGYFFQGTPASVRVTPNTTWDDLINQLAVTLGVSVTYSPIPANYAKPEPDSQLWCNLETAALLLDAVAYNVGRVVVRNLDGTYNLLNPAESLARVNAARGNAAKVVRSAGGDLFSSGTNIPAGNLTAFRNSVVPQAVVVTFPKYVTGNDPVPHFVNPRTTPQRPSAWYEESYGDVHGISTPVSSGGPFVSGLTGVSEYTIQTTAKALYSGEADAASGLLPYNQSGLQALANQLARNYYTSQASVALDEVYPGTLAWQPEGFHDVIWSFSARAGGAFTRVMRTEWNSVVRSTQHSAPPMSGQTNVPIGVGGPSVAQTVRDSAASGGVSLLSSDFLSGAMVLSLASGSAPVTSGGFPQANRWRGTVDQERILFEGLSGGTTATAVYRGIDGSLVADHYRASGATATQVVPDTTYGVNLVTFAKNFNAFPGAWTSGGISEAVVQIAPGGIGSGDLGSGVIQSGMINSGNLSFIDWTFNYITYNTYPPGFVLSGDISSGTILSGINTSGSPAASGYNYYLSGGYLSGTLPPNYWYYYGYYLSGGQVYVGNTPKLLFAFSGDVVINGFLGGVDGRLLYLWNVGPGRVLLKDMAAGVNSILLPIPNIDAFGSSGYVSGYTVWQRNGCILEYDGRSGVWRFDHPTFAGGDFGSPGLNTLGPPATYALQHLRFGSGLIYQDKKDGSANVSVNTSGLSGQIQPAPGAGGGGGQDWFYWTPGTINNSPVESWAVPGFGAGQLIVNEAVPANVLVAVPLPRPRGGTLDKVGLYISAPGMGVYNVANIGVYSNLAAGKAFPNAKLTQVSGISTTNIGFVSANLDSAVVSSPGDLLWLVFLCPDGFNTVVLSSVADVGGPYPILGFLPTNGEPGSVLPGIGWVNGYDDSGMGANTFYYLSGGLPATFASGVVLRGGHLPPAPAIYCHFTA